VLIRLAASEVGPLSEQEAIRRLKTTQFTYVRARDGLCGVGYICVDKLSFG